LQRKKSEGMADIQIKSAHPAFVNWEAIYYLSERPRIKSLLLKAMHYFPKISDNVAGIGATLMDYYQQFNLPIPWLKMNRRLHQYWYLRGLMRGTGSTKELHKMIDRKPVSFPAEKTLKIDLSKGLRKAEQEVDEHQPLSINVFFADAFIGTIEQEAGWEPTRGYHLRKLLKRKFYNKLADVVYPHDLFAKKN